MRIDPFLKVRRMHYGLDFSVKKGTPIYATADGDVYYRVRKKNDYGKAFWDVNEEIIRPRPKTKNIWFKMYSCF